MIKFQLDVKKDLFVFALKNYIFASPKPKQEDETRKKPTRVFPGLANYIKMIICHGESFFVGLHAASSIELNASRNEKGNIWSQPSRQVMSRLMRVRGKYE